jgi:hypothetical protein
MQGSYAVAHDDCFLVFQRAVHRTPHAYVGTQHRPPCGSDRRDQYPAAREAWTRSVKYVPKARLASTRSPSVGSLDIATAFAQASA